MFLGRRELGATISAELFGLRIIGVTFRALDGQAISPTLAWPQIIRGVTGKSIVLDAAWSTEYDNSADGRVRVPVNPLDFKSGMGL
jgi:hypothetical protein